LNIHFLNFNVINLAETEAIAARCMGQNARNTLIVFQAEENAGELRTFLAKMLAAAQLDLEKDVLTLQVTETDPFSFSNLCQHFNIQSLLVFGIPLERLGIHFALPPYHILQYEGRTYVCADDLAAICAERQQGGKRMSGESWKVLQTLFLK